MSVPSHVTDGRAVGHRGGGTRQALNQSPSSCPQLNSGLALCGLASRRCQLAPGVRFHPPTAATLGHRALYRVQPGPLNGKADPDNFAPHGNSLQPPPPGRCLISGDLAEAVLVAGLNYRTGQSVAVPPAITQSLYLPSSDQPGASPRNSA